MKIAIVTDKSRSAYLKDIEGQTEDIQKHKTVRMLKEAISKKYDCIDLVFDDHIIENLQKEKVDLVFNICNGVVGSARISQLPAILESIEMPYTGSDPLGHGLAYNKVYTGKILKECGIPTPEFKYVTSIDELKNIDMKFPLFIKPSDEGSSRGIYQDSIVKNKEEMYKVVKNCLERYNPPIMIMEFIKGEEFTVGIIENGKRILPIIGIDYSNLPEGLEAINSFEVKNYHQDNMKYHIPAKVSDGIKKVLEDAAIDTFRALGLKDYARVDIILSNNIPYMIDVNSLPGLQIGFSDMATMAKVEFTYDELILGIIDSAKTRYNLKV